LKYNSANTNSETLLAQATQSLQENRLDEATQAFEALIIRHPDIAELHLNLGVTWRRQNQVEQAILCFQRALEIDRACLGAHYNLANARRDLGRFEEAEAAYRNALEVDPAFVDAANNLGELLSRRNRYDEACLILNAALIQAPKRAELHNTLGNALKELGELETALSHLQKATECSPDNAVFQKNMGAVQQALNDWSGAQTSYDLAIELDPDDADARCLNAFCLLGQRQFKEGWQAYEWRWHSARQEPKRPFDYPHWDGADLRGKTVLVWGEQGIGDEIMFSTTIPDLLKAGAEVVIECRERLCNLFRRSFPDARVIARLDPPNRRLSEIGIDVQVPIGSLPRWFRNTPAAFAQKPSVLKTNSEIRDTIRARYRSQFPGKALIGFSWRSGEKQSAPGRSMELDDWAQVLNLADSQFISLQYGDTEDELSAFENNHGICVFRDREIDPAGSFDLFAAQCAALDLVVSVANTTVHVAGALGIPTWTLLAEVPDWRWGPRGEKSLWYPSMELIRQTRRGDWSGVMETVGQRLNQITFRSRSAER